MKNTLNLSQTAFPMRADLPKLELKILERWRESQIYETLRSQRQGSPKFILNDGPPYANGPIHLGHAVNKVLKDLILKSKTLEGFDAPFLPGWDCHGLPIEVQVEKLLGKKSDPVEFRKLCRDYAQSQITIQKSGFIRLGVLGSWEQPYKTMDPHFEAQIIRQVGSFVKKNLIQSGFKPVHWCPLCASSLSDAETEFVQKISQSLHVIFHITTPFETEGYSYPLSVVAWTTTPWTLPSNQAVAYNPNLKYTGLLYRDHVYLVHSDKVSESLQNWHWDSEEVKTLNLPENALKGLLCEGLFDSSKTVPLVPSDHVISEKGTGFVHCAPDHGPEDYELGVRFGLKPLEHLDIYGKFKESAGLYLAGFSWIAAESLVIDFLKNQNKILNHSPLEHQYLTCWRHKKPIFYRATAQWFVTLNKEFKEQILQEIPKVKWHPASGELRMRNMIATRPDWCISRQRFWGTPLVLVFKPETRELHPNILSIIEKVSQAVEIQGLEAWYELSLADLGVNVEEGWVKSSDTLDVWFDSGSVFHILTQELNLHFPADLYLEGSDQYRGWFQSSLICSSAYYNQSPYKEILTHGFLVDQHGKKMSKSLGNVIDPHDVAEKHGVDILRLWVSMTNYEEEIVIAPSILERTADSYRRIRNTLKFILANIGNFSAEHVIPHEELPTLDRWIIDQVQALQKQTQENYAKYRFSTVSRSLIDFCVNDLGAFYLDVIKDRLYTCGAHSHARRSAQTALKIVFESLLHQILPILPFTAEEAWEHHVGHTQDSPLLHVWPSILAELLTPQERALVNRVIQIRKTLQLRLEDLRQTGQIGSSLEAQVYITLPSGDLLRLWAAELKFIFLVSKVEFKISPIESMYVEPYLLDKCPRCWHRIEALAHEMCDRCHENVHDYGERRYYA